MRSLPTIHLVNLERRTNGLQPHTSQREARTLVITHGFVYCGGQNNWDERILKFACRLDSLSLSHLIVGLRVFGDATRTTGMLSHSPPFPALLFVNVDSPPIVALVEATKMAPARTVVRDHTNTVHGPRTYHGRIPFGTRVWPVRVRQTGHTQPRKSRRGSV